MVGDEDKIGFDMTMTSSYNRVFLYLLVEDKTKVKRRRRRKK
jgi:hypothetical protein